MNPASYVPDAGDIVWLNFTPQAGHEQAGRRPAVVLSPASYNRFGLMLCCPMTTRRKDYPFEVPVGGDGVSIVLADQIKSLDWKSRDAQPKGKISALELSQIRARAAALIGKP